MSVRAVGDWRAVTRGLFSYSQDFWQMHAPDARPYAQADNATNRRAQVLNLGLRALGGSQCAQVSINNVYIRPSVERANGERLWWRERRRLQHASGDRPWRGEAHYAETLQQQRQKLHTHADANADSHPDPNADADSNTNTDSNISGRDVRRDRLDKQRGPRSLPYLGHSRDNGECFVLWLPRYNRRGV
jgi:hypothetical protein